MSSLLSKQTDAVQVPMGSAAARSLGPLLAAIVLALALHFLVPLGGGLASKIAVVAGINIILAVSLTMVNGFTGQFSIGHAGFMAVGGYAAGAIVYYGSVRFFGDAEFHGGSLAWTGRADAFSGSLLGWGDLLFVAGCIVGGAIAAGAGYVVGLPSLRLRGDYLAIVTLGFGEIVRVVIQGTNSQIIAQGPAKAQAIADVQHTSPFKLATMLGGAKGLNFIPTYTTIFWLYVFVAITLMTAFRLKNSSSGRALLSIREDEVAAQAMGVDITKWKVRAFVLSSFFAGVAGALYAMDIGSINAGELGFQRSFEVIIMVVLGGLGSISGAVIAAIILSALPEVLRGPFAEYRLIVYSLLLILMMILRPQGLMGVREVWDSWLIRRQARRAGGGVA